MHAWYKYTYISEYVCLCIQWNYEQRLNECLYLYEYLRPLLGFWTTIWGCNRAKCKVVSAIVICCLLRTYELRNRSCTRESHMHIAQHTRSSASNNALYWADINIKSSDMCIYIYSLYDRYYMYARSISSLNHRVASRVAFQTLEEFSSFFSHVRDT